MVETVHKTLGAETAQVWEHLLAESLASKSGTPLRPKRTGLVALRLGKEPQVRATAKAKVFQWPNVERAIGEIDQFLRTAIRKVVVGEAAWPLMVSGPPGTGKTCASLCLLDHVANGEYFTVPGLCSRMNQAQQRGLDWSQEGRSGTWWPHDIERMIADASLVVLDEIGCRERVSDAHYETVKMVLDARHYKPFVALSNVPLADLGRLYDARIVSRLAEGTVVQLEGSDRRLT